MFVAAATVELNDGDWATGSNDVFGDDLVVFDWEHGAVIAHAVGVVDGFAVVDADVINVIAGIVAVVAQTIPLAKKAGYDVSAGDAVGVEYDEIVVANDATVDDDAAVAVAVEFVFGRIFYVSYI